MLSKMRRPLTALAMLLAAATAIPAQAQFSDSYKFLEAVRKKEGDKVQGGKVMAPFAGAAKPGKKVKKG